MSSTTATAALSGAVWSRSESCSPASQDASAIAYELEQWHLSVVASGAGAPKALREAAAALDRRLLLVQAGGEETWAWLGSRRRPAPAE